METSFIMTGKKKQLLLIEDAMFIIQMAKSDETVILPKGSILQVKDGQLVDKDEVLALYDSSSRYAASFSDGLTRIYRTDDEIEVAIYDDKNEQTIEVLTEKVKGFKKFDKLGISSDLGTNVQLKSPGIFVSVKEKDKVKVNFNFLPNKSLCYINPFRFIC